MLAIQKSKSHQGKCTPNILPCRINHNGPVDTSKRYWNPTVRDGKTISYFRGRKLYARQVKVPKGYKGVVISKTEQFLPRQPVDDREADEEEEEEEKEIEVKIAEEVGEWDSIMVWGHEAVMDEEDPYVRGVEEWVGFSAAIHDYSHGGKEMETEQKH